MQADRTQALAAGEHDDEGVLGPDSTRIPVRDAAPEVDDHLALDVQGDGGAEFAAFGEVALELPPYFLVAGRAAALHYG